MFFLSFNFNENILMKTFQTFNFIRAQHQYHYHHKQTTALLNQIW